MARYIDADAVIAAVRGRISMPVDNLIVEMIRDIPTISPDEVRGVGEWEIDEQEVGGIFGGRQIVKIPCCSNCGTHNEWKTNYCPNCGAKMEVSEDTRKN